MGEMSDDGKTDWADTVEYKNSAMNILNILIGECFPYSDTYRNYSDGFKPKLKGRRPVCEQIETWDSDVGIDDVIANTVMPYGLAAQLLLDENPSSAAFFQQRYEELLRRLGASCPNTWESIENMYGVNIEYGEFGRW